MNCAYKFRIYPNKEQQKQIAQSLGCARFIFNRILELSQKYYWKEHTFWTDGYFVASVGDVSAKSLQEYIQNQG